VIRANFDLPPGARIADALSGTTIAVSPAGDLIAFTAVTSSGPRMYIRHLNELVAREVEANASGRNLTFSPDSRWLAFTEGNVLRKVAVDGGQPVAIGSTGGSVPYGLVWSPSDTIYIGSYSGIWAVAASGGTPVAVARVDSSGTRVGQRWPLLLPGGKAIAYAAGNSSAAAARLAVVELGSGRITEYPLQVSVPLRVLGGQLVFISAAGELMAVPFDPRSGRPSADPLLIDDGLLFDPTAGAKASLSASGTLVFLRGRAQFQPMLVSASAGKATPLLEELRTYANPRFSPDGRRVAIAVTAASATDVWIYDVDRNTLSRLTTEGVNVRPEWTPDGRGIVFVSDRRGRAAIWRQPVDGGGPAELLYQPEEEPFEAIVSPDSGWLVFRTAPGLKYPRDILAVPWAEKSPVTPLVTGPNSETMPRISPDGKWLAYQSNENGRFEIYVRAFPGNTGSVQVSADGGTEPLWARDGRSLYYRGPLGEAVRVAVTTGNAFAIGSRTTLATGEYLTDSSHPSWDVAPDGRLLMLKRAGAEAQVIVVHNWGRELSERTAGRP
jgi:serine/threonine-protein kinase